MVSFFNDLSLSYFKSGAYLAKYLVTRPSRVSFRRLVTGWRQAGPLECTLTVNAALRPDYVRNKESPMFLRKVLVKF